MNNDLSMPGDEPSSSDFCIYSRFLLLAYQNINIDKTDYHLWILTHLVSTYHGGRITLLELAYHSGYTYVLLFTYQPIITSNPRALDYQVRPLIRVLAGTNQVFLGKQFMNKKLGDGSINLFTAVEEDDPAPRSFFNKKIAVPGPTRRLEYLPVKIIKHDRLWKLGSVELIDGSSIPFYIPEENKKPEPEDDNTSCLIELALLSVSLMILGIILVDR